jgi:hypothetical protein
MFPFMVAWTLVVLGTLASKTLECLSYGSTKSAL